MDTISRRGFIGTSAGVVGAATVAPFSVAAAETQTPQRPAPKDIRLGMLTAPVTGMPFDQVMDLAKSTGVVAMEVISGQGSKHVDPTNFGQAQADAIKKMLADRGLEISALSNYGNSTKPGKTAEVQDIIKKTVDAAVLLGVPTINMISGMPEEHSNRIQNIKTIVPQVFRPIIDYAKGKGINIAIENWFETNLQGIDTFDCLLETLPDENFGLNYDPSHLVHQQIDILVPVKRYSKRIFHTHAKDCLVDFEKRGRVGIYGDDWWRYAIPGYGNINWGEYIGQLRKASYKGVLSIEHEDETFNPEDGFKHGARYLGQFC